MPGQAARTDEEDDAMDDVHRRLFSVLMDHDGSAEWPPRST